LPLVVHHHPIRVSVGALCPQQSRLNLEKREYVVVFILYL